MKVLFSKHCSPFAVPALFSVALLALTHSGDSLPNPMPLLTRLEDPSWEEILQRSLDPLDTPGLGLSLILRPWGLLQELMPELVRLGFGKEVNRHLTGPRDRRGEFGEDLGKRPLRMLPDASNTVHLQSRAEEGGEQRDDALNSIAGGLQAFNREKGGFGFRFGRK